MKHFVKVGTIVFALSALAAAALAGDISGIWHGKAKVDLTKVHQPKTAGEKSMMIAEINKLQNDSMTMTLNANHTFSVVVSDKSIPSHSGTWKQQGNKLILAGAGNKRRGAHNQVFTLAADGKSLSSEFGGATFTFKR